MTTPKICIVSSCGGHLTEARLLRPAYENCDHFYVLNERIAITPDMEGKTYFVRHSERDWLLVVNLWEAWHILRRERPDLILSTGAGPAVPFAIVGRVLSIPSIFVESIARVTAPSLAGRLMYRLSTRFFYQWESLSRYFPKAVHGGPIA